MFGYASQRGKVLSSSVGLKSPIQEHKVACWHGDRGRVGVGVCKVRTIEDVREVRNILGDGERKKSFTLSRRKP